MVVYFSIFDEVEVVQRNPLLGCNQFWLRSFHKDHLNTGKIFELELLFALI
jgi:hypothetical protein